jgi:outer membrane lipoprotein
MAIRTLSSASVWARPSRPLLALLVLVVAAAGCATTAPIRQEIKAQATPVDFSELATNPDKFKGETVILGGQIIKTTPTADGTLLTVLETKTKDAERPGGREATQGRFMALAKGFLDPQVYSEGRQVTVAGKVAGKRMDKVGELEYAYPLINADQVYLWPRPDPYYYYPPLYGSYWPYYYPYGPYGAFGPWWW